MRSSRVSPSWTAARPALASGSDSPLGEASSAISPASVTHTAPPSRSSRWQPAELALCTDPGTAPTARPRVSAWWAVFSAPDLHRASTTTVTEASAAMSRFRCRNRYRVGAEPGGTSARTAPWLATARSRSSLPEG